MAAKTLVSIAIGFLLASLTSHTAEAACKDELQSLGVIQATIDEHEKAGFLLSNITFTELGLNPSESTLIHVVNGSIYTKDEIELDGETNKTRCDEAKTGRWQLTCAGVDTGALLIVQMNYSDDHDPKFPPILKRGVRVKERVPLDRPTVVVDFTDPKYAATDEDCNSQTPLYDVSSESGSFNLTKSTIIVAKELDYERQNLYKVTLRVMTSSTGSEYRTSSMMLMIYVDDVDDERPDFTSSIYTLHVMEGPVSPEAWLTTEPPVLALDGDRGINTTLNYSIVGPLPTGLNMDINLTTGQLRVLDALDRETNSSFMVVVKAAQTDNDLMTATSTIKIVVDDRNDNRPVFTSQTTATVQEDARPGTTVLLLTATDQDEGINSQFDYVMASDDLAAFNLSYDDVTQKTWLVVSDSKALRGRETGHVKVYLVEKSPPDGGAPCDNVTTCVADITVTIADVNMNSPVFTQQAYRFSVQGDAQVVGQVIATDTDRGDNARISYKLPGSSVGDCRMMSINESSGEITLSSKVASLTTCYMMATACDNPHDVSLQRCTSVPVSIILSPPANTTASSTKDVTIPENVPVGTIVTDLPKTNLKTNATDFKIVEDILYTNADLDREKQDSYRVLVFEDTAGSVALIVNVHVGDVNDNRPAFDQGQYQITLGDDVTPGQVVLQVNATDADLNDNSRLTYRILTCGQWFSIDGSSGKVKVITSPPSDVTECSLEVSDAGTPPLQSHTSVMIYFPLFNETAMVILPTASSELMADREGVARKLSGILGVNVHIHSIDSLGDVPSLGSKVYISATTADGHKVSPTDLNSLLKAHAPAIYSAFQKSTKSEDSEKLFTVPFSVVLALAILLLLICLLFAVLLYRQRQKYKINLRLFEKLHQDTKIYDATRSLSVTQIPEVRNGDMSRSSRSNGSARSSRGETEVIPYFSSLDQGYVNSTFVDDDMTYSNIQDQSNVRRRSRDTYDVADVPVPDARHGEVTERASLTTEVTKITEPAHVTVIAVRRLSHGEQDRESLGFEDESPPLDSQHHASLARRPSEADSGVPAESHHDDDNEDDDDKEVADIYANVNKNNTAEKQPHTGPNLDLMTFAQTSAPTTSAHTYTPHDPYEPEPDYAKRVHFNEEASAYGERPEEEIDQPSTEFVDSPSHHGDLANEMFEITAL